MKLRQFLELSGAALLVPLPFIDQLFFSSGSFLLHNRRDLTSLVLGVALDMAATFLLGFALLALVPHLPSLPRKLATGLIAGLTIWWVIVSAIILLMLVPTPAVFSHLPMLLDHAQVVSLDFRFTILAFTLALAIAKPRIMDSIVRGLRLGLAAFSFCGLWIVPQLIYFAVLRPAPSFNHPAPLTAASPRSRVVWILFDELSYDLVFDHPPNGMVFPHLQSLRSQSVSFANIASAGSKTEQIVPALLDGRGVESLRGDSRGELETWDRSRQRWTPYDPNTTLFGVARDHGWNPGVVGWYNPYCRIFRTVLSSCSWRPGIQDMLTIESHGASERKSAFANAIVIPRYLFGLFFWHIASDQDVMLHQNLEDYQVLMDKSQKLIQDERVRFLFLHLPVPHPPGIFDRNAHRLCTCGNYLDNLALTDDTLGVLLQQIQNTPSRDETTIVISSDHSWRVSLWKPSGFWTPEEERLSQHYSDERPVFLVHFPGQQSGATIQTPMSEFTEHDIFAAMLQNKLETPDDMAAFLHAPPQSATPNPVGH